MIKTISFRADPETLLLLKELKQEMQIVYGVSVSNSDIIRKALKELQVDFVKSDIEEKGWKE